MPVEARPSVQPCRQRGQHVGNMGGPAAVSMVIVTEKRQNA
jgi:hypothetical protein